MATVIEEKEKFEFTAGAKKQIIITILVGLVLTVVGLILYKISLDSHAHGAGHHAAASHAEEHGAHHLSVWMARLVKDLWQTNIFFTGIAVMGTFFVAFNYVAWAGWSAALQRVPMSFGMYVPFAAVVTILMLIFFGHDLFHWMDPSLTKVGDEHYDPIIASKTWYLNTGFFWARTIVYFLLWIFFWWKIRQNAQNEDINGGDKWWHKNTIISAGFLVIWGVTESTSTWDWVMSMDPHFYSTMFGWYVFASWFVSALAMITLFVLFLKDAGYLKYVTEHHLHDLGKYMFAFSIFWTYVWFEQFLLIYYANIPEESQYYLVRLKSDPYMPFFFFSLLINFFFPFLWLMTRGAKRQGIMLKVVAAGIIFGHWIDFYNMMTPPVLKENGGFDFYFLFIEVGVIMVFLGAFLFMALTSLSKINIFPKNHPMIEESKHHSVF